MTAEQGAPWPRRRLSDLLAEAEFLLVQLLVLQEESGAHRSIRQQQRISALRRRLDAVEQRLRERAAELGIDGHGTFGELRRTLGRRLRHGYRGPERRRAWTQAGLAPP
jgi:hypothetical protein